MIELKYNGSYKGADWFIDKTPKEQHFLFDKYIFQVYRDWFSSAVTKC